ncbi:hypothetical protein [Tateyamaria sp. SN3-11]|uniref:hypothetical protein n=1 Tax=Tateyamaria sp. SN3-11 TaxID=3092147 RepID=UPI0039ECCDC9
MAAPENIVIEFNDEKDSFIAFGKLMETWANPSNPAKPPQTIKELIDQAGHLLSVRGHTSEDQRIAVCMLPASDVVSLIMPHYRDFSLQLPSQYSAPQFYGLMNKTVVDMEVQTGLEEEFRFARIADYAMRKCV